MEKWILPIFLIISGLNLCGVGPAGPRWVNIAGGVCGMIAAVIMVF